MFGGEACSEYGGVLEYSWGSDGLAVRVTWCGVDDVVSDDSECASGWTGVDGVGK